VFMRMMIAGDGHAACRIGLLCRVGAGPFEGGDQGALQAPVSSRRTDLAGRLLRLETSCLPPRAPDWRRRRVRGLRVLPRGDCVHVGLQPHRPGDEAVMPCARRMGRFDDAWLHRCVRGHRSLRPAHGRAAAVRLPGSAPLTVWRGASRRRLGSRHPASLPSPGSGAGVRGFMSVWLTDP